VSELLRNSSLCSDVWSNIWYNRNNYFLSRYSLQYSGALRAYISAVVAIAFPECILSVIIFMALARRTCFRNTRKRACIRDFPMQFARHTSQNLPTIVKSHKRLFDYGTLILRNCATCCLRRIEALKLKYRIAKQKCSAT